MALFLPDYIMKWNGILLSEFHKTRGLLFAMQDFLFLLRFVNLNFAEVDIFVWFNDIWNVSMNLNFAKTFFFSMTMLYTLFQPVDKKIT